MQISDLADWVRDLEEPTVAPLLTGLRHLLDSFTEIGLGYLSLERPSGTLSGGEAQRTKMIRHLGSALTDVTYVFDEPTIGLHAHDIERMNALLLQLRDKGNTVLVVEHKPETIVHRRPRRRPRPRRGQPGGRGGLRGQRRGTARQRHRDRTPPRRPGPAQGAVRTPTGALQVRDARTHNLRDVDVDVPLGVLFVVTGVAGSGKSSLVDGSLLPLADADDGPGVVSVDQAPIRGSRRSNPATYTGLLDPVRKAFAKANGVKPALFSPNSDGACPGCNGAGVIYTDLAIMAGVATPCEECEGRRFQADGPRAPPRRARHQRGAGDVGRRGRGVLRRRRGPDPGGARRAGAPGRRRPGLPATLGQPLPTLSGGERQRLKLATHMKSKEGVLVLDEPTTGLHLADVEQLLALLDRLVDGGRSVVVVEHHQAVMAHADWILDLGPGAGHDGGRLVFEGTPADLVADASTLTGQHLAAYTR